MFVGHYGPGLQQKTGGNLPWQKTSAPDLSSTAAEQ